MMTAALALIDLALTLALPQIEIGRRGGGHTMAPLIHCCHGRCHWHHLCLCSWNNSGKDDGRSDRQGHHADIRGQEEVGHHGPIGIE